MKRLVITALLVLMPATAFATPPSVSTPTTCTGSEASCISGNLSSAQTTHNVDVPTCAAGKILMIFATIDNQPSVTWPNNAGDSTTSLKTNAQASVTSYVRYRVMTGSDTDPIAVTTDTGQRSAFHAYCVTGWDGTTTPECGTSVSVSGVTTVSPPTTTPAASGDYLSFVSMNTSSSTPVITGTPGSYTNTDTTHGSGRLETAYQQLTGISSENPGDYTTDVNVTAFADTCLVKGISQSQAPRSQHQYRLRRVP